MMQRSSPAGYGRQLQLAAAPAGRWKNPDIELRGVSRALPPFQKDLVRSSLSAKRTILSFDVWRQ